MNDLDVGFVGEPGVDANGLKKETFSLFWVEALNKLFDGGIEVVPIVDPASSAMFKCLGVILTHGYILTGFYPVNVAEAVSTKLLVTSGSQPCCDDILLSSMLMYCRWRR